jgi:hypothetical protein
MATFVEFKNELNHRVFVNPVHVAAVHEDGVHTVISLTDGKPFRIPIPLDEVIAKLTGTATGK